MFRAPKGKWKTRDGKVLSIFKMDDLHLDNSIKMVQRNLSVNYYDRLYVRRYSSIDDYEYEYGYYDYASPVSTEEAERKLKELLEEQERRGSITNTGLRGETDHAGFLPRALRVQILPKAPKIMFETHRKGEIAQLKAQLAATEKGFIVSRPTVEARYDFIMDDGVNLFRVQVKYADVWQRGAVHIDLRRDTRNNNIKKTYSADEIDLVLVYVPKKDCLLRLDKTFFDNKKSITVRFRPPERRYNNITMVDTVIWWKGT